MKKIENVLEIAMEEKGKTLRPEIQLMNKVLSLDYSIIDCSNFKAVLFCEVLKMRYKKAIKMERHQKLYRFSGLIAIGALCVRNHLNKSTNYHY